MLPKQHKIPDSINETLQSKRGIENMDPGESTWTVPWALGSNEGNLFIKSGMVDRHDSPGGTVQLKVFKDFEGVVVDATALTPDEVTEYLTRDSRNAFVIGGGDEEPTRVDLILLPAFPEEGNDPQAIKAYNAEQQGITEQFKAHHEATYHQPYTLAAHETVRHR